MTAENMARASALRTQIEELEDDLKVEWDDDLACRLADLKDELKELEQ